MASVFLLSLRSSEPLNVRKLMCVGSIVIRVRRVGLVPLAIFYVGYRELWANGVLSTMRSLATPPSLATRHPVIINNEYTNSETASRFLH